MHHRSRLLTLAVTFTLSACLEGGANQGGRQPGNTEGGIDVGLGEIAVAADGRYFLSLSNGYLMVGDLQTRSMRALEGLPKADLLSFWPEGAGIYLISYPQTLTEGATERVLSFDLAEDRVIWSKAFERLDTGLDVAPGGRLVLWGAAGAQVLDGGSGESVGKVSLHAGEGLADLDVLSDGRLLLTHWTERDAERRPTTDVSMHSPTGQPLCRVTVPNCDSELVVDATEARAFLAPTRCGRDPVSVIELEPAACRFRENLPGFGPVAPSPDGRTMVAFMDRDDPDPEAPARPTEVRESAIRFHLMFIDVETLAFDTTPIGDVLPRYTFTPDGRTLIVDHSEREASRGVLLLDVDSRSTKPIRGPVVDLDTYVLTPDSRRAFVVDAGLYTLDLTEALVESLPLSFVPISINITPAGDTLLLKDFSQDRVYLFDVDAGEVAGDVPSI